VQVMSRHRDAGSGVQLERSIDELLSLYRDLVRAKPSPHPPDASTHLGLTPTPTHTCRDEPGPPHAPDPPDCCCEPPGVEVRWVLAAERARQRWRTRWEGEVPGGGRMQHA